MYTSFFGLHEKPFSITPDPRYLFLSERHGEALAHLVYGVTESGGFIQLTGEVGTGKTTLVRSLLLNRMPENADVAVVLNPQLSVVEFLATICEELHIELRHNKGSIKALTDALNRHLLEAHAGGRRIILVVDEAQNLAPAVLEQVRLLTNLETAKQKLLQIILIGQPELRELLARTDLRQLAQRITARYHLEPLSRTETGSYIEHRLKVAGALGEVFDAGAKKEVFRLSQGVPRLVNVICDRALLGAYARESRRVNARLVREATAEVKGELQRSPWVRRMAMAAAIASLAVIGLSSWLTMQQEPPAQTNESFRQAAIVGEPEPEAVEQVAGEVAPEPFEPVPTLFEQLQMATDLTDTDYALAALFETWGLEYRMGPRNGCAQAADAGLACLVQRASWAGLVQMDRPAILTLVDDTGNNHAVVLTAVMGNNAEVSIGGVRVTHPIMDIAAAWFGDFTLLWRPPTGVVVSLAIGSRGSAVAWLRNSLAAIDPRYASTSPDSRVFDEELDGLVRAFQRDHRLDVDGVAGQQTQIIINTLLAVEGTPRLSAPRLALE
jgi:general secretion pathway protein A